MLLLFTSQKKPITLPLQHKDPDKQKEVRLAKAEVVLSAVPAGGQIDECAQATAATTFNALSVSMSQIIKRQAKEHQALTSQLAQCQKLFTATERQLGEVQGRLASVLAENDRAHDRRVSQATVALEIANLESELSAARTSPPSSDPMSAGPPLLCTFDARSKE